MLRVCGLVGEINQTGVEGSRPDELEKQLIADLFEQARAAADHDGGDPEDELIDVAGDIGRYGDGVAVLLDGPPEPLPRAERDAYEERSAGLIEQGMTEALARRTASAEPFLSVLDIVDLAREASKPVDEVATVYLSVGDLLALDWLRDRIAALPFATQWEMLARVALREDLYSAYRQVTASVLRTAGSAVDLRTAVTTWVGENRQTATRVQQLISEIRHSGAIDAATLAVALREIRNFVSATADITEGVPLP